MLNNEMKEIGRDILPAHIAKYVDKIANHLLSKTRHYRTLNETADPSMLGNTNFWLIRNKKLNRVTLGFSAPPSYWDIEGIKFDIMAEEHKMYEENGVAF